MSLGDTIPVSSSLLVKEVGLGVVAGCSVPKDAPAWENQDAAALLVREGQVVLVLADGVGGGPAGARAAALAVDAVTSALRDADRDNGYREAVLDGFERANAAVLDLGVGAASTLAVAVVEGRECRTFHAGDSSILITGQRGRLKHWTIPHSPVGYALEAGMLAEEEALVHEQLNIVLNCIGSRDMRIEIGPPVKLAQKDTLIVGSDGLFDNLTTDEIVALIRKGPLEQSADALREMALGRMAGEAPLAAPTPGKPDDLTFLLFRRG